MAATPKSTAARRTTLPRTGAGQSGRRAPGPVAAAGPDAAMPATPGQMGQPPQTSAMSSASRKTNRTTLRK